MARFTPSTARTVPKALTSPSVSTARSPIMLCVTVTMWSA